MYRRVITGFKIVGDDVPVGAAFEHQPFVAARFPRADFAGIDEQ